MKKKMTENYVAMEETMCSTLNVSKGLCKQKSLSSTVDKTQQGFKKYMKQKC